MQFRLSTLLLLVAVAALLLINIIQWRFIDTIQHELQHQQQVSAALKKELMVAMSSRP